MNYSLWSTAAILLLLCVTFPECQMASDPVTTFLVSILREKMDLFDKSSDSASSENDLCTINYDLLDPGNIAATRKDIGECIKNEISCASAKNNKYRTMDGSCNNLKHPMWGKSDICLQRILPFDYKDNVSYPRESCTGKQLPNPRHVSIVFHKQIEPIYDRFTTFFMEWGQMIAHDLSNNDVIRSEETGYNFPITYCCDNGPVFNDECISSPVPPDEPLWSKFGMTCIPWMRTVPCQQCNSEKRQHSNQATAYHDLSLGYGSNEEIASEIRSGNKGMLKVEYNNLSEPMLPVAEVELNCESPPDRKGCYHSGDKRTNQNLFLLTFHTILLHNHNIKCEELSKINPHWSDEKLYQEARRINIAQVQYISYSKYLPNILGKTMEKTDIGILPGASYTKYNSKLDATVTDEFTASAARYGHTIIPGLMSEIDPSTNNNNTIRVRDYYFNPFEFNYGQFDKIAKGMTVDHHMKHDRFLSDDVRDFLYRRVYRSEPIGDDLAAISIVRGTDHGIPGYTYYLSYFFNITIHSFDDLRGIIDGDSVDLLEELYDSVHDIDLYSAGLAENHAPGGIVGPTFAEILVDQYRRLKFGDRYWFEHGGQAGSFTSEQLLAIKFSSPSRILCDTTKITEIQIDAFLPPSETNPVVSCTKIPPFNYLPWKEQQLDTVLE